MTAIPVYDQATKTDAVDGEVTLDGPDGIGLSMTPEAAEPTAQRLAEAASRARSQPSTDVAPSEPGASAPIAHGQRIAAETHMVDDKDQIARVQFRLPVDGAVPADEVTTPDVPSKPSASPIGDVGSLPKAPDVWEALPQDVPPGKPSGAR